MLCLGEQAALGLLRIVPSLCPIPDDPSPPQNPGTFPEFICTGSSQLLSSASVCPPGLCGRSMWVPKKWKSLSQNGGLGPNPRFPIPLLCPLTHSCWSVLFALLTLARGQTIYTLYLVDGARLAPRQGDPKCLHGLLSHLSLHMGRLEGQERTHNLLPTL